MVLRPTAAAIARPVTAYAAAAASVKSAIRQWGAVCSPGVFVRLTWRLGCPCCPTWCRACCLCLT
jgi:hypothetical protein